MDCIDCKTTNPDGNYYCGQCGTELGRYIEETVRKKGLRDRYATEMEITEAVVGRLMKWAGWLGTIAAVIVVFFGLLLGKSYMDVRKAVNTGKTEINTAIRQGFKDISEVRHAVKGLRDDTTQLNSDIVRYKLVNSEISKLQKDFKEVQGQMIDFGKHTIKAETIRAGSFEGTTTTGPSYLGLRPECPPASELQLGSVAYCAQGSPPSLFQLTSKGELRPVSSRSPVGFQDVSNVPKPTCTAANRGTFYVEKGTGKVADKPYLCAKHSDNTYGWVQLGITP